LRLQPFQRTSKVNVSGGSDGMNNQWGRSGGGTASGGGGIGGILFASVVSLALGAAGGYGAFRMMDSAVPTNEIEQRDQRISDLARELDARVAQVEDSSQKAQALTEENGGLKRQLETLRKNSGTSDAAAALAENVRLNQEVPELKSQLELASQLVADAEALKKRAEEAVRDRDRQLSLRRDDIARLEKALAEARSQQSTTQSAETERQEAEAALRRELEEAQRAKDTIQTTDLPALRDEVARLEKALAEARSEQNTTKSAEAERQEAEAALRRELEEAQRAKDAIQTTDLPALRDEIARKDKEIAALKAGNASLTSRISALETAARSVNVPGKPDDGGDKPVLDNKKPTQVRNPRSAVLVALAIDNSPGLDRLSSTQREQLERTLVSGECVTKALDSALQRVPVLALRNLMRDLDSDC
jgi:DNA repair exonuclease SbcCD ATPase subunit